MKHKQLPKGLGVYVYRDSDRISDCTNNGISSKYTRLILVGEDIPKISTPETESEIVILKTMQIGDREYKYCVPYAHQKGTMFGGNFISTCDSRFPNDYPIAIHDRLENSQ